MSNLISRRGDESLLLHCNWGWDGKYDGYFAGKAFDAVKGCYLADDNAAVSQTRGANAKNSLGGSGSLLIINRSDYEKTCSSTVCFVGCRLRQIV